MDLWGMGTRVAHHRTATGLSVVVRRRVHLLFMLVWGVIAGERAQFQNPFLHHAPTDERPIGDDIGSCWLGVYGDGWLLID